LAVYVLSSTYNKSYLKSKKGKEEEKEKKRKKGDTSGGKRKGVRETY